MRFGPKLREELDRLVWRRRDPRRFRPAPPADRVLIGNLCRETPLSELFDDQQACTDMVVNSKTDVMKPGTVDRVLEVLGRRPRVGVHFVTRGEAILGLRGVDQQAIREALA